MQKITKSGCICTTILFILLAIFSISTVNAKMQDEEIRGIIVRTYGNLDFPSSPNLTAAQIRAEINSIVTSAASNKLNTIFLQVKPLSDSFYKSDLLPASRYLTGSESSEAGIDVLSEFISISKSHGIDIFAYIEPTLANPNTGYANDSHISQSNPAAKSKLTSSYDGALYYNIGIPETRAVISEFVREVAGKYDVKGVHIGGNFYPGVDFNDKAEFEKYGDGLSLTEFRQKCVSTLLKDIKKVIEGDVLIGCSDRDVLSYKNSSVQYNNIKSWISDSLVDYILTYIPSDDDAQFNKTLESYSKLLDGSSVDFIPVTGFDFVQKNFDNYDPFTYNYLVQSARSRNSAGLVLNSSSKLPSFQEKIFGEIDDIFSKTNAIQTEVDLTISTDFAVTRPLNNISYSGKTYFIMGTSDPSKPVFVNGEQVEQGSKGTFGCLVDIPSTVTVSQGDKTIVREISVPDSAVSYTSSINENSIFPRYNDYLIYGETIELRCIAPADAVVTATIFGQTIELAQQSNAKTGVPVVYKEKVIVPDGTSETGNIPYTLNFNGSTKNYTSKGKFAVVSDGKLPSALVKGTFGNVWNTEDDATNSLVTTLIRGSIDTIVGRGYDPKSNTEYFQLSCGGFIPKYEVDLIPPTTDINNIVSKITFRSDSDGERYLLRSTNKSAFLVSDKKNSFTITFMNTENLPEFPINKSKLFESFNYITENSNTTITLETKANTTIAGYSVEYVKNDIVIYFKYKKTRSTDPQKPLDGITIMLDAGHGGTDPGALGPAYSYGPTEKDLALALANRTKIELEKLGAIIYMTRTNDSFVNLDERVGFANFVKPDAFVALHYNSVPESTDASKATGVEGYYCYSYGNALSANITKNLAKATDTPMRKSTSALYRVTRTPFAKSVLIENGFMPNPKEYERICTQDFLDTAAKAISQGILDSF